MGGGLKPVSNEVFCQNLILWYLVHERLVRVTGANMYTFMKETDKSLIVFDNLFPYFLHSYDQEIVSYFIRFSVLVFSSFRLLLTQGNKNGEKRGVFPSYVVREVKDSFLHF